MGQGVADRNCIRNLVIIQPHILTVSYGLILFLRPVRDLPHPVHPMELYAWVNRVRKIMF